MKLADIIETFISGDWGEETVAEDTPNSVFCIRGADIVPITNHCFNGIPQRFVCDKTIENKTLKAGDLIIEKSGGSPTQSTGRIVYVSEDLIKAKGNVVCSNFCTAFRVKAGWNPLYVYYFWQNVYNHGAFFNFEGKTSGIKNLQLDNAMSAIDIEYLPLEKQNQIVASLASIDEKIKVNRQINDNLEAMAKQLYDYWFVQFDFPNEEGKPYKSSGGAMVWNENLKREIPQGWVVEKMGKCTNVLLGGTPDTNDNSLWGNGYNWLNSGEVAEFPILKSEKNITPKGLEKSATVLAPKGSVTLSITRHLRPSILCIDACINQSVVAILENDKISKEYIYPLLNRDIPRLMSLRTGAQQPHINKGTVEAINVILPPANIMGAYINKAESIYNAIFNNAKEVEELTKQRDELLPLLMNGQATINYHLSAC